MSIDRTTTLRRSITGVALALALGSTAAACGLDTVSAADASVSNGTATVLSSAAATTTVTPSSATLSDEEIAGLLWMRAEEQLAHDVDVALGEMWNLPVFTNIAASESRHIESVVGLLDSFAITDTSAGNAPGVFTDPTIQSLYDTLVVEGSQSVEAALSVGARIEELDIRDLRDRLDATSNQTIRTVYDHLERASGNHLRAFTRQLDQRGETYVPEFLDADDVAEIVDGRPGRQP